MTSPYLDRPLLPLAVALPRMLQEIETALATAGPAETRHLRQRADLIRELLTPSGAPHPPSPTSEAAGPVTSDPGSRPANSVDDGRG
jgi:hypothetical protein